MGNPFEDQDALFLALASSAGEHSLWPSFTPPPPGWRTIAGPAARPDVLALIEANETTERAG